MQNSRNTKISNLQTAWYSCGCTCTHCIPHWLCLWI